MLLRSSATSLDRWGRLGNRYRVACRAWPGMVRAGPENRPAVPEFALSLCRMFRRLLEAAAMPMLVCSGLAGKVGHLAACDGVSTHGGRGVSASSRGDRQGSRFCFYPLCTMAARRELMSIPGQVDHSAGNCCLVCGLRLGGGGGSGEAADGGVLAGTARFGRQRGRSHAARCLIASQ